MNKTCIFALILTVVAEVVVNAVDCINTCYLFAVYIVVIAVPTVCGGDAILIFLTIRPLTCEQFTARCTLKNAVNNFIAMSRCGNSCAPVNYRIADFAERSACVARFCAGSGFVGDCVCCMDMSTIPCIVICLTFGGGNHILRHLVHLGVDLRTFTGECIGRTADK